jgi:hypothetical protein
LGENAAGEIHAVTAAATAASPETQTSISSCTASAGYAGNSSKKEAIVACPPCGIGSATTATPETSA